MAKSYFLMKIISVPSATEGTAGVLPIASTAETIAGVLDNKSITPLKLNAAIFGTNWALYESGQYIAWETILANDSLFVESLPTFAESTVLQNIGDVTANTRVAILWFGSGVASNTLELSLRKFVSPSANLSVRIETVSGWNPTGTLVNANATATVTSASVTTSLVDTTITLAGSITITKWQQVAIVLSQVWNVVNATNYYAVGYSSNNTSTIRKNKLWNGTSWIDSPTANLLDSHWISFSSTISSSDQRWFILSANRNIFLVSITKDASCTATRAIVKTNIWTVITTATFSWNIATLSSPIPYRIWNTFRIECDNSWASYNSVFYTSWNSIRTNINYTTWSINGVDTSQWTNITGITTIEQWFSTLMTYISSNLFENRVLAETNASFNYKLPTDYVRLATQGYSIGQSVTSKYYGLHNYPWLVNDTVYFIANTPWAISAVAGTNESIVWYNSKQLYLWYPIDTVVAWTNYLAWSSDTDAILSFTWSAVWTKLKEIQIKIWWVYTTEFETRFTINSNDNRSAIFVNWVQVWTNRLWPSTNVRSAVFSENFNVPAWALIQVFAQKTNSGTTEVRNFRVKNSLIPRNKPLNTGTVIL